MMQPCNKCSNWAQWRVRKPIKDANDKITGWELIAMLCGTHKQEQESIPDNSHLKFHFIGAAPVWQ